MLRADTLSMATQLLQSYEGFRSKPYKDVNALRLGYGSDTVTKADGSVHRVTANSVVTREDAMRDLQRRIPEFASGVIRTVGQESWNRLPSNVQAALISIAYNYGSIGKQKTLVNAVKSGNVTDIANAIRGMAGHNNGDNANRRNSEANVVMGGELPPASGVPQVTQSLGDPTEAITMAGYLGISPQSYMLPYSAVNPDIAPQLIQPYQEATNLFNNIGTNPIQAVGGINPIDALQAGINAFQQGVQSVTPIGVAPMDIMQTLFK